MKCQSCLKDLDNRFEIECQLCHLCNVKLEEEFKKIEERHNTKQIFLSESTVLTGLSSGGEKHE